MQCVHGLTTKSNHPNHPPPPGASDLMAYSKKAGRMVGGGAVIGEIIVTYMCLRKCVHCILCDECNYTCHLCQSQFSQLIDTVCLTLAVFELVIALQHLHYPMNINQRAKSHFKTLKSLSPVFYIRPRRKHRENPFSLPCGEKTPKTKHTNVFQPSEISQITSQTH